MSRARTSSSGSGGSSDSEAKIVLPTDHIISRLLGDFKEHTKVKIDIFIRDDKIKIEDFFEGSDSKTFHNVLEALTEVSRSYLSLIAGALLQWRSSQHVIPAKSISKPKFKDNLNDTIGTQIESICFDNFKIDRRPAGGSPSASTIPDLCATILGQLSKYRLRSVSTRFFKEFQICLSSNTQKSKTFPILQGIRFFRVKISTAAKLKVSQEFLTSYLEFFKNPRIKGELRRPISEILASILRPLTEHKLNADLSYTEWFAAIKEIYDIISKKTKKTKDIIGFWGLMDSFIKNKDKTLRPYALESAQYLLECYLTKFTEQPEEVHERLHLFVSHIFPSGHSKKLTLSASDALDIFIDIICVIANTRLDFAFEKIIFDLLRGGDAKDTLGYVSNPERMIVGLRAVMLIDQAGTTPHTPKPLSFSHSGSPASSPLPEPAVANKVRAVRRQRYGTLNNKKQVTSLIEPYIKALSIFLSQILVALDQSFGSLLTSIQTKPLNELLEKLRPPGPSCLELLKISISAIPISFPARMSVPELVLMLSRYLIHLDRGVCEKSAIVLRQLMATRPDLRPYIIGGLGKFALSLPDRQAPLACIVLEKMSELLDLWAQSKSRKFSIAMEPDELKFRMDGDNPPEVSFIESVAMVFLCSSYGKNRRVAISILDSIRRVHDAFLQARVDDEIEISTHIIDIIEENGDEYVHRYASGPSVSRIEIKPKNPKQVKKFSHLVDSELKDDQHMWTVCLSDIARAASELCPSSIGKATELIMGRIKPIQPEENPKTQSNASPEAEALAIWWRNYIVVASASIQVSDNSAIDIKRKMGDISDMPPVSARELFNLLIPFLKSTDKFFSDSALMAMEKTHPRVLEVLFDVLKPFEHELHITKKTKKKYDGLRSAIAIRRHCLETLKPGELGKRENLKKSYTEFIQEVLQFLLTESYGTDSLWDNLCDIRFNFCALVHRLVQQLCYANEFLDKNLRRDLFRILTKYSESEELIKEDSTFKRLQAFVAAEEKEISKRKDLESRFVEFSGKISHVASHAVSVILYGPFFIDTFKDPNGVIFQWINSMFLANMKTKAAARLSLQNYIKGNMGHTELIYHCVNQCYSSQSSVANNYFLALVELCQDQTLKFAHSESIMTNLIVFNMGTNLSSVRQQAIQLLYFMKASAATDAYHDGYYPAAVGTDIADTYLAAQYRLSERLASEHPELAYDFFMDVVYRLEGVSERDAHAQMLHYVLPWIEQMHLIQLASLNSPLLAGVLQGLILITIKHPHHTHLVEKIWRTLGKRADNIGVIIDFLLDVVDKTRNEEFIPVAKRISIFLGRSSPQKLVDYLVSELSSTSTAQSFTELGEIRSLGKAARARAAPPAASSDVYNTIASIAVAFHHATSEQAKSSPLSRFQVPLIFLSEVAFEIGEEFRVHLPLLLQLTFLGLYYNSQPVHEHSHMLLLNLIRSLVIKRCQLAGTTDSHPYEEAIQLIDFLLPSIYRIDEASAPPNMKELALKKEIISSPQYVVMLTRRVASVLSAGTPDLNDAWGGHAIHWATTCTNHRLSTRSYQIIRGLEPTTTVDALTDVTQCLGKFLANIIPENIILINEVLETLYVMIQCIHPTKLILFPQMFWGIVALLYTDFESHFTRAINILSLLLDKVNFEDRAVQNVFLASMPKEWDYFKGVQPLVLRGLLSDNSGPVNVAIAFLSRLTLLPCDEIFHAEPIRFLANLISLLPMLCVNIGEVSSEHLTYLVAERLSIACENAGFSRLSTIFQTYHEQSYHKQLDKFLGELAEPLCESVTKQPFFVFSLLFNILESGLTDYRYPILKILTLLVKGGVNPAHAKSPRIGNWYDTVNQFINDHKMPSHIVAQSIRLVEITSAISQSSLLSIDNASMKPSRSVQATSLRFSNKPERGTFLASSSLSKVLDSCTRSTSLSKSMYTSTQIFEKFFSSTDDIPPPRDRNDNTDDSDDVSSSVQPGSDIGDNETEMVASELNFENNAPSDFHNFPHFQGFNDILEGLGNILVSSTGSIMPTSPPLNKRTPASSSSPTLSRNMQYQTNSTLSTLSYNVTAAKSWWNSCSEQIEFQSEKEIFDLFVAAAQLVQQISIEYKTLFNQCLPVITSVASEALTVDMFDKSVFAQSYTEVQNSTATSEKYKKILESKPALAKSFMEQREKLIEAFTLQLNVYTEQRTSTNNSRAKLFENGISNDDMQIQIAETRFCFAMCGGLYQQLLQLWNANLSLQELLVDYTTADLLIDKQREEVKKELNKSHLSEWDREIISLKTAENTLLCIGDIFSQIASSQEIKS
eukprot:gene2509-2863_t